MSGVLLRLDGVHTYYGLSHILRGVSMSLQEGEIVALLGRNGMGKTTLIHTIAGLVPTRAGAIEFADQRIDGLPAWRVARRGLGLVPQGHRVFPTLTVAENIRIASSPGGSWTPSRVQEAIPILSERRRQRAGTLSGGQQQMLTLARALVRNSRLLLMDEPSEGLDLEHTRIASELIVQARDAGSTVLLVEQRVAFALDLADRVMVLSRGALVFEGSPTDLMASEEVRRRYLGVGI